MDFSHPDADSFCAVQEKRVQAGEICDTYALIMRKAAFSLADYFSMGGIRWKRRNYNDVFLPESYEAILGDYETYLSGTLAPVLHGSLSRWHGIPAVSCGIRLYRDICFGYLTCQGIHLPGIFKACQPQDQPHMAGQKVPALPA